MAKQGLMSSSFIDPSLIHHFETPVSQGGVPLRYPGVIPALPQFRSQRLRPSSPDPAEVSGCECPKTESGMMNGADSLYLCSNSFRPYPQTQEARRFSIASSHSRNSAESPSSSFFDEEGREKGCCPHPDCGRPFKDLKAHMLTHQSERPEKCPIATCAYHTKGFARKYDKNRHTLTHYKGTMVCGFCPGSGSPSEKSFNRADVFKRHLTSVHGVEQTPPNSRKKSPAGAASQKPLAKPNAASGTCSTCSVTFNDAQSFYEHLDDCVLRIVQQEEPSEAINDTLLRAVNEDDNVRETLGRHMLPADIDTSIDHASTTEGEDVEGNDEDGKEDLFEDEAHRLGKNYRSGRGRIPPGKKNPS